MGKLRLLLELCRMRRASLMSEKKLKKLQTHRVRKLLRYAYKNSSYYRSAFEERGISESGIDTLPLCRFPTLDKELLMEHFDELVTVSQLSQAALAEFDAGESLSEKIYKGCHIVHSSGSTGQPRYFVYDKKAWERMLLGIIRGALWDMSAGEIFHLLKSKPRILYVAATDGRYGGALAVGDGIDGLGTEQMQLNVNTPLDNWKRTIDNFRPNIVIGYPSAVKILAQLQGENELNMDLTRIITCGELLSKSARAYIESVFPVKVVNFYGASESLALGVETDPDEGMYLFDDMNYIEVVDGQMYLTCLYNRAQPLIRYRLSDTLKFKPDGDNKKYGFSRVEAIGGRDEDILWFRDAGGKRDFLHPLSVEGICVGGLRAYQFRQLSDNSFDLLAEIRPNANKEKIEREIKAILDPILAEKGLTYLHYTVSFTDWLSPDPRTGKTPLIVRKASAG